SKIYATSRLKFDKSALIEVEVSYDNCELYPNEVDPSDLSVVRANGHARVSREELVEYDFHQTRSSPQFALYLLSSPEGAAIWHGAGRSAGLELLRSYASVLTAVRSNVLEIDFPWILHQDRLHFDLTPELMLVHPKLNNVDASANCLPEWPAVLPKATSL